MNKVYLYIYNQDAYQLKFQLSHLISEQFGSPISSIRYKTVGQMLKDFTVE